MFIACPPQEASIYELGFILLVAAISDTFVVRAALVPMVMSILGNANWWPRRMPPAIADNAGRRLGNDFEPAKPLVGEF